MVWQPPVDILQGVVWWYVIVINTIIMVQNHQGGTNREVQLKGTNRAKTTHPGEFDVNEWIGGGELDYRFFNARTIVRDIFESEGKTDVKSK